ncbi:MAG: tRNA (adenosine(37)-N6)-dimethylallyltransferase MiaA [Flavobacteriia bacterium]|nr:tRNA (adenosine(37)-N6)-dimethylallyltransferase MiaA [Flavobacteriia bacterium]
MTDKQLILIQGPTASGKTELAIKLAQYFNTIIVSADSRQFYKEMKIGTAVPSVQQLELVPHYFIHSHSVKTPLSAAKFEHEANLFLEIEFRKRKNIIVVGGSGLFMKSLIDGLDDIPHNIEIQKKYIETFEKKGIESLLMELKKKDNDYFEMVDKNNPRRIIRALEAISISGKKYSELRNNSKKVRNYNVISFTLLPERTFLYSLINQRVEKMLDEGLLDEAKALFELNNSIINNTVGYSELFSFFKGELEFDSAIELLKQNTRNYAKRQFTWFKKNSDSVALEYNNFVEYNQLFEKIIKQF